MSEVIADRITFIIVALSLIVFMDRCQQRNVELGGAGMDSPSPIAKPKDPANE